MVIGVMDGSTHIRTIAERPVTAAVIVPLAERPVARWQSIGELVERVRGRILDIDEYKDRLR